MTSRSDANVLASLAETIRNELRQKLSSEARIHLPLDEDTTEFDKANLRFTQYERPTYLAVVDPSCENDVVEVVKYAREKGIPFTPRGGHHAVTTTMRRFQNGICINMRPLSQMRWDAEKRYVTAGGGAITDEFVRFVHDLGMEVSKCNKALTGSGSAYNVGRCRVMSHDWCHWRSVWCWPRTTTRKVWLSKRQHGLLQGRTRRW
jgi:UDP-N-acetylenolpyruvoylglucosamine reductase